MESSRGLVLNPVRILCKSCAGGGTDHAGATTVSSGGYIRKRLFKAKMQVLLCRKPDSLLYPYQPEAGGSFPGSGRLLDPRL